MLLGPFFREELTLFWPFGLTFSAGSYLDVDEQLQEVLGGHDDGGIERGDIALIQIQIQIGSHPLQGDRTKDGRKKSEGVPLSVFVRL